jgi:hypothetical protein
MFLIVEIIGTEGGPSLSGLEEDAGMSLNLFLLMISLCTKVAKNRLPEGTAKKGRKRAEEKENGDKKKGEEEERDQPPGDENGAVDSVAEGGAQSPRNLDLLLCSFYALT